MNWFLSDEAGSSSRGVESTNVETMVDRCCYKKATLTNDNAYLLSL
jgi:hypothetical protein